MTNAKVLGLAGFGLEVPGLDEAHAFYQAFGLEIGARGDALVMRSPGRDADEGVLVAGARKRLHHVSFFIDPASAAAFAEKLQRAGTAVQDTPPPGGYREGLWFRDPWGTWINLTPRRPAAIRPERNLPSNDPARTERVDVAAWQEMDPKRPPLRLGHMLMFTQEWEKAERFYCDVLGLRATDRAAGKVAFLAAGDGVIDHHCFGLINSTHRGFQHASFQVASLDDIGFGAWRMREAGYKEAFGPGRHAIASNLFHYIRDPWGSWVEYYADMDKITERWVCRDWKALPYIWGPEWSPEFWGGEMNGNHEPR